ncbi:MAG: DNA topoisomerase I [Candidatus Staskawiczbacteria bacterium RIFCSPHIGHO2_02_FULL_43_16]|uniref:DNA topoisomerase 1 n=1 Tax=Candidatus Staskawiczbacteria bacterium RIFCSPHIGHO2_01_FULL_41_41 TaxID=1802203 RepID=A0A1G2HS17_9BACT|nr:MAG: DNA topoisomerase I [Candidatus Staskawiczbacteria bacterium RIFCSPHIGHO2_01_FULL_41_41]OGZ68067.1 MAG: DNA topoisomerase I [Candidatus Staskawiczbacteria bacterium RIFCSPHIGHO2_02_FULL_43_16]OGZ74803.1 MAG: DNA topoisomerase I [Candidatus Staskawiczbacteria bacterium RIFCSPLOWO2_01_FULL_43_17b]
MQLVIVESPTKAKTIQKFLGVKYKIRSSYGHVRDLPKNKLGVDVDKNFEPSYIIPVKAKKVIAELKKDAKAADEVILATDEDREGESISWHLAEALKLENPKRIVFHEITKTAIEEALANPREIDMALVNAQQARRVLDRIVGYKLSPFLWKKINKGLSAGRVQSVAVRLVVEKEEEIKNFVAVEYWTVEATLRPQITNNKSQITNEFIAQLTEKDGEAIDKLEIKNRAQADEILRGLENAEYKIEKITKKETHKNPLPPFTTSTLQQAGSNKFGYSAKMTMSLAQKLYEEGHITYHRTDSLNLSQMSLQMARDFITKSFGKEYSSGFKAYKAGKGAQEAHEAIRPTHAEHSPESLKGQLEGPKLKIYTLIWQRFLASQMVPAVFDSTAIEISAGSYGFGANGQMLKFDGFLKVYPMKFSENDLPALEEKEVLDLARITSAQHFTEPPARYNEASLIKALEKHGIGRPSTYAPTLSTIQDRNYIIKNEQKRFAPTEMGTIVTDMLVKNFPQIVDIEFTAKMEKELDEVAEGKDSWQKTIGDFYGPFAKNLKEKYDEIPKEDLTVKTDKKCPKCGKDMVDKMGRFGRFYACTGFPECKHTESIVKTTVSGPAITLDIDCPKCAQGLPAGRQGKMAAKKTRRGKIFYACDQYPTCDMATWDKPINEFCPTCKSILVQTIKGLVKCSSKECDFKKE